MLTGRRCACVNATTANVFPVLGKPSMTTCVSSEIRFPLLRTRASVSQGCVPASVRSSHLRRDTNGLLEAPDKAATDLTWWARQVLNLRPLACEASALPLSYAPPENGHDTTPKGSGGACPRRAAALAEPCGPDVFA